MEPTSLAGPGLAIILGYLKRRKLEFLMFLPFVSKEKKTICSLKLNLGRIKSTINETDQELFLRRINNLYPRLRKYENIRMPMIIPVNTGIERYDSTWQEYHIYFLKRLIIDLEDDKFDLDEWNTDVMESHRERSQMQTMKHEPLFMRHELISFLPDEETRKKAERKRWSREKILGKLKKYSKNP